MQARDLIKQQIADDKKARQSRGKPAASPVASQSSGVEGGGKLGGGEGGGIKLGGGEGEGGKLGGGEGEGGKLGGGEGEEREGEGVKKSPSTTCKLQVRNVTYIVHVHVGCAVLLCLVVCLTLLACFFLPSTSLINMYKSVALHFNGHELCTMHIYMKLL